MADILITVTEEVAAAGYASAAEAAAAAAEESKNAAQAAELNAETAETNAETAASQAENASTIAQGAAATATTKAQETTTNAQQAETAKNDAVAAQIAAAGSADAAELDAAAAAQSAITAAAENEAAQIAAGFANSAKIEAISAKEAAQLSADNAQGFTNEAAGHSNTAQGAAATATTKATLATGKAAEAEASAAEAANSASSASSNAQAATTKAEEASLSAAAAAASELAAQQAQTAAETAKSLAEVARDAAALSKTAAETAENNAELAQAAAELAKTGAETARDTALNTVNDVRETGEKNSVAIASLENTINSANINQETTATVTGVDTIALPKTAANTGMQVQMFGQSAENLVVNGDFNTSNGWLGGNWIISGGVATNNGSNGILHRGISIESIPIISGNVYIIMFDVLSLTADLSMNNKNGGILFSETVRAIYNIGKNSVRLTASATNAMGIVGGYNLNQPIIDNLRVINLTATFGSGSEPTKEQCDILFANYFEGSDNVLGTGRVRSVGKNLFDKTKVALNYVITQTGGLQSSSIGNASPFIGVSSNKSYRFSGGGNTYIAYYNSSKQFISSLAIINNTTVTTPANTYFVRFSILYANMDTLQFELGSTTATYEPFRQSILQLTTPPLRSNGLIKDEIRKGANGYELVKRVGVGTLGDELIVNTADREFTSDTGWWTKSGWTISGGTANANGFSTNYGITRGNALTVGRIYKVKWDIVNFVDGSMRLYSGFDTAHQYIGGTPQNGLLGTSWTGAGTFEVYIIAISTTIGFGSYGVANLSIDNVSWKELTLNDGNYTGTVFTNLGNIHYTLDTPVITPIAHAGLLNSNSNGTVYFEPIIADAGVYSDSLAIQLTDYPIASFESIRKYANGTYTELNIATAVIAGDGLSFTHPDLVSGDLVMFTYAYNKESIGRSMTLTHYDSRFVEADTANGKVYRWGVTITNGVPTLIATEV